VKKFTLLAEQGIVNTPSIHADPCQLNFSQAEESAANFPPESRHIPMQAPAVLDRLVLEAMDFLRC